MGRHDKVLGVGLIALTVNLGYNDTSFHTTDIVINRISVRPDDASMFHAKYICQDPRFPVKFSLITLKFPKFYVNYAKFY